jgi:hypothetical protein
VSRAASIRVIEVGRTACDAVAGAMRATVSGPAKIMDSVTQLMHSVIQLMHSVIQLMHSVIQIMHSVIQIMHSVIQLMHSVIQLMHSVIQLMHSVIQIMHSVIQLMHSVIQLDLKVCNKVLNRRYVFIHRAAAVMYRYRFTEYTAFEVMIKNRFGGARAVRARKRYMPARLVRAQTTEVVHGSYARGTSSKATWNI